MFKSISSEAQAAITNQNIACDTAITSSYRTIIAMRIANLAQNACRVNHISIVYASAGIICQNKISWTGITVGLIAWSTVLEYILA